MAAADGPGARSGERVGRAYRSFRRRLPGARLAAERPRYDALVSIAAWSAEAGLANVAPPLRLDAATSGWPVARADALLCINMVHISPWSATLGLLAGAARILPSGAPLILYGPYVEPGVPTAPSNIAFDASLRARNPEWGLRDLDAVKAAARDVGLAFTARQAMPANNLMLLFRRS
jgi:hypothetical protein